MATHMRAELVEDLHPVVARLSHRVPIVLDTMRSKLHRHGGWRQSAGRAGCPACGTNLWSETQRTSEQMNVRRLFTCRGAWGASEAEIAWSAARSAGPRHLSHDETLAGWHRWLEWASGCGPEPVLKAARMIREHLWGIVNAIILRATNGPAEGINSRIKTVKVRSRGFRNRERFANATLYPPRWPRPLPRWPTRMTCYPPERGKNP